MIENNAITINQIDTSSLDNRYIRRDGGNGMIGNLNIGNNRITNLGDATSGGDALSRSFGDSRYVLVSSSFVNPPLCNEDNQALGWDGSNWICNSIQGGVGGGLYNRDDLLVNEFHTVGDCLDLGGQISVDEGDYFCRISGSTCPSGWMQFKEWSEWGATSCGNNMCGLPCTTSHISWLNSNTAPICTYGQHVGGDHCQTATCVGIRSQIGCY